MSFIITLVAIIQSFSISLGVGSSTLAILNFFGAIADGTIDATERRMMGIVYIVLRVAIGLILVSTLFLIVAEQASNQAGELSAFAFGQITALAILFINAVLMTLHLMPSTFGPSIQAGSWYTLGTLAALLPLGLTDFTYVQFLLGYLTWIVLAVAIVNGVMAMMKAKNEERKQQEAKENPA
jgi:hypothetical protein